MTRAFEDLHVAVLMGGLSAEREVSLTSGEQCAQALERQGVRVSRVDAGRDLANVLSGLIKPDVALNCLHGAWGEDGCVQGVLETLRIPYSHSGVLASALAMDKNKSKAVLKAAGIKVPGGGLYDRHEVAARHVIAPPYVVKPNAEATDQVMGAWFMAAPDAVGADAAHMGDAATSSNVNGRLSIYWVRRDGQIAMEPQADGSDFEQAYYIEPRTSGAPVVVEPYEENIGGGKVAMTSVAYPVRANGRIIGVAGDFPAFLIQNVLYVCLLP